MNSQNVGLYGSQPTELELHGSVFLYKVIFPPLLELETFIVVFKRAGPLSLPEPDKSTLCPLILFVEDTL
jgi:hypothetical protein